MAGSATPQAEGAPLSTLFLNHSRGRFQKVMTWHDGWLERDGGCCVWGTLSRSLETREMREACSSQHTSSQQDHPNRWDRTTPSPITGREGPLLVSPLKQRRGMKEGWNASLLIGGAAGPGSICSDDTGPTTGLRVICAPQWPMLSCPHDNRSLRPGLSEEELVLVLVFIGICSEW